VSDFNINLFNVVAMLTINIKKININQTQIQFKIHSHFNISTLNHSGIYVVLMILKYYIKTYTLILYEKTYKINASILLNTDLNF